MSDDLIKRDDALKLLADGCYDPGIVRSISALPAIDPAATREAALREAADVCLKSADNFYDPHDDCAWEARGNANAILALIGETK